MNTTFRFLGLICLAVAVAVTAAVGPIPKSDKCFDKVKILKEAGKTVGCDSLTNGKPVDHDAVFISDCLNKKFEYTNKDGTINVANMIKAIQATAFDKHVVDLVNVISKCTVDMVPTIEISKLGAFMECFSPAYVKMCTGV